MSDRRPISPRGDPGMTSGLSIIPLADRGVRVIGFDVEGAVFGVFGVPVFDSGV